jgi:predicted RNA-binding Zn ribbon-like protein
VTIARPARSGTAFSFRSDRLSLDFAATLMFRQRDRPRELLGEPADLARWAREAGVVSQHPAGGPGDLEDARHLREAIYRSALGHLAGEPVPSADRRLLNRFAAGPSVAVSLTPEGIVTRSGTLAAALGAVARDAVELLGGPEGARLRQCGRDGCTRLFVDRSRGANRSWCGMRECGNRVNAAAYRRRRRSGTAGD